MRTYKKLTLPTDTAWERKTWRRYVHWRIRYFIDGVRNIFRWMPTIYHDRDWDHYYITKLLQKKIEYQREYLVKHNRHMRVSSDNFWMTVVLNLIEREHEEYYSLEYQDYIKEDMVINDDRSLDFKLIEDDSKAYLAKHKAAVLRMVKENYFDVQSKIENDKSVALILSMYNQERCRKLIFKILETQSNRWWD